jgi:hypothetical protein
MERSILKSTSQEGEINALHAISVICIVICKMLVNMDDDMKKSSTKIETTLEHFSV